MGTNKTKYSTAYAKMVCECGNEQIPLCAEHNGRTVTLSDCKVIILRTDIVYYCYRCGKLMKLKTYMTDTELTGKSFLVGDE